MFFKTVVAKNFAIFTGKHLYWSLFLIKNILIIFQPCPKRDFNTGDPCPAKIVEFL